MASVFLSLIRGRMTGTVAVELSPIDVSSPYASALIETCSIGMHFGARCVLEQDSASSDQTVIAVVSWHGPLHDGVRLEVGLHVRGRPRWQARQVSFAAGDPEVERWRTAGFAIATFVGEAVARDEAESNQTVPGTEDAHSTSSASSAANEDLEMPARSWLDGRFVLATGAQGFAVAQGAELRFSRMLDKARWFLVGALQCTFQRVDPYSISMVVPDATVQAGVVAFRLRDRVEFAVRVGGVVEAIEVTGRDSATGAADSGGGFRAGLKQGIDISWLWSQSLGFVVGADVVEASGPADIRAHQQLVAHIPAVSLAAGAGLRLTLP